VCILQGWISAFIFTPWCASCFHFQVAGMIKKKSICQVMLINHACVPALFVRLCMYTIDCMPSFHLSSVWHRMIGCAMIGTSPTSLALLSFAALIESCLLQAKRKQPPRTIEYYIFCILICCLCGCIQLLYAKD
jgi:hypothetical protein